MKSKKTVFRNFLKGTGCFFLTLLCLELIIYFLVPVYDAFRAYITKGKDRVVAKLRALAAEWDGKTETMTFFQMSVRYKFAALADQLAAIA